jgi:hypothetical protein
LGALLVGAFVLFMPRMRHTVGFAGVVGMFAWVAVFGGFGRPGSAVAGVACLGVTLLVPLVRRLRLTTLTECVLVGGQVALVAYESRVVGLEQSGWDALLGSLPALAAAWLLLFVVTRAQPSAA